MKTDGNIQETGWKKTATLLVGAIAAAIVTLLLLVVFAFIMLKTEMTGEGESIGIICISVLSCFAGGFFCGRKNDTKGFLWGLAVGCLYFLFLLLLRIGSGQEISTGAIQLLTTFLYCGGSGMLGGMLS